MNVTRLLSGTLAASLLIAGCNFGEGGPAVDPYGGYEGGSVPAATCARDADCVVSCTTLGSCCDERCFCTTVYHRDQKDYVLAKTREVCGGVEFTCVGHQDDCGAPSQRVVTRCDDGRCASELAPVQ